MTRVLSVVAVEQPFKKISCGKYLTEMPLMVFSRFSYIICTALFFSQVKSAQSLRQHFHHHSKRAVSAAVAIFILPFCSVADTVSPNTPSVAPEVIVREGKITSKVYLDVSIARSPAQSIKLGIYGDDAPAASKFFLSICKGDYGEGVSYDNSQVSRIQKDKRIDVGKLAKGGNKKQETWMDGMGKVRIRSVSLASKAVHNDENEFRHDAPGVVSMRKGGGTFDFTLTSQASPSLDDENVVIGKVLTGMDVLEKINNIPVSKEDIIGSKGGFSKLGKGTTIRVMIIPFNLPAAF